MSGDNYFYVYPYADKFWVTQRFASAEYGTDQEEHQNTNEGFDTVEQAYDFAEEEASGVTDSLGYGAEYGWDVSPNLHQTTT